MNKLFSLIYKAVCNFSLVFSAIILFFWCIMASLPSSASKSLDFEKIKFFFIFALIFGVTSLIFAIPKLPTAIKALFHLMINDIAFAYIFPLAVGLNEIKVFLAATVFIVIYALVFAVKLLLNFISKPKKETDYDNNQE